MYSSRTHDTSADHNRKKTLMLLTNKYEVLPQSSIPALLTVSAFLYVFMAALNIFLLWLSPLSLYVLLVYLLVGMAATRLYFAGEVSRRQRRGPTVTLSNAAVTVSPMTAPIYMITAETFLLLSLFPVSLISVALTRTILASSPGTSLTAALDVVCVALGAAGAVGAVAMRRGTAYRPRAIHDGPIVALSPTHLEFHPLLSPTPIRIPWDQAPFIAAVEYPTVKRDVVTIAHVMTTASPTPTLIDITCLSLTPAQLQRTIGCFACRPQYRGILATAEGPNLVRALVSENPAGWPA